MPGDVEDLKVAFARLSGVVETRLDSLEHTVRNVRQSMDALVTRREVDSNNESRDETRRLMESRIERLEGWIIKLLWLLAGAWIAGLGVASKVFTPH